MTFEPLTPERRREMTRRHLLEAAAIVFARNGFHGSTLDEVAATAGFTKGAVYSNFTSKDDLFLALLDDRMEQQLAITAEVLESGSHDPGQQLFRIRELLRSASFFWDDAWNMLYLEFVLYAKRNPEALEKLVARSRREHDIVQAMLEHEFEALDGDIAYPPREYAEIAIALFNGLAMARLLDPESVTDKTVDIAVDLLQLD